MTSHDRSMRSMLLRVALGLLLTAAAACGAEPAREVVLEVRGMTCGGCAETVHAALAGVRGVREVEVDHEAGSARVQCPAATSPEALAEVVRAAGEFQVRVAE